MRLIKRTLLLLFFFSSIIPVIAQKPLNEGTITYDISIQSTKSESAISNGLTGAVLTLYIKPTISKTEMVSSLGTESAVYDNRANKGFILKEYSGQKLMITATKENWLQKNQWNDNMKFTISNELEDIAGYKCKKATGLMPDGKEFTVYFTTDVVINNKFYNNSFSQLPGLPVQYELRSGNLVFKYKLNKVSFDPVPSARFEAPKTGFRVMTYEENQQLKKGDKK